MFLRLPLALGVAFGLCTSVHAAATWSTSRLPWTELPAGIALGPAPQVVSIPTQAYSYGARSERIDVFAAREPVILCLTVGEVTGKVGVVVVTLDGSTVVSKEAELKPGVDNQIYFRLRPGATPGMFVLRNYAGEGTPGSALIRSVRFVRESDLDNEELSAVAAAGIH